MKKIFLVIYHHHRDFSGNSGDEFVKEDASGVSDSSDSEIENENKELSFSNENIDRLFVSKNYVVWNPQQGKRYRTENLISLRPNVTG